MDVATTYEDTRLEAAVTSTAAALLATELLGAVCHLTPVLGLCCSLTLVCEVLDYVKIDSVVIWLDAENLLIENHGLSRLGSVNFQNFQFHNP